MSASCQYTRTPTPFAGTPMSSVEKCALLCVFVCCRVTNHRKSLGRYSQFTVCSMCSQSLFCPSSLALFLRKRVPEFSVDFAVPVQRESNLKRSSKRGRRAGVLTRFQCRSLCPPLPAIVLTNAQLLKNKTDELFQLMSFNLNVNLRMLQYCASPRLGLTP